MLLLLWFPKNGPVDSRMWFKPRSQTRMAAVSVMPGLAAQRLIDQQHNYRETISELLYGLQITSLHSVFLPNLIAQKSRAWERPQQRSASSVHLHSDLLIVSMRRKAYERMSL